MKTNTAIPGGYASWWKLRLASIFILVSLLLLCPARAAESQVLTPLPKMALQQDKIFEAVADSYIFYDETNLYQEDANFGKLNVLRVGNQVDPNNNLAWQKAFVRFHVILKDLPPNAVITSAWAQIFYERSAASDTINLFYGFVPQDWDEYRITYNNQPDCLDNIYQGPASFFPKPIGTWINIYNFIDFAPQWLKDGEGVASLCIGMENDNFTAYFSSKEGPNPPHILISYYIPPPERDTPIPPQPTDTPFRGIVVIPTKNPPPGNWINDYWWLIAGIAVLAAFSAFLFLRPRKPPIKEPPGPVPPPMMPPLRLLRFWLTQSGAGGEQAVSDSMALAAGGVYNLNVQVQVQLPQGTSQVQTGTSGIPVDLVFYSPESDFLIERRQTVLEIPASGSSARISVPISPQKAGVKRVRLCIYHQNTLLQSAVLEAAVVAEPAGGGASGVVITRLLDYVASPFLTKLGQSPRPALNIFTNETAEGTHWVGVYSSEPEAGEKLRQGQLFVFEADHLSRLAQMERQSLAEIQGGRAYRQDFPLPLDERSLERVEQNLVSLALQGFRLYNDLFLNDPSGLGLEALRKFDAVLRTPGIISVARCRGMSTTLPWASIYSFPLDIDHPDGLRLCEAFKDDLRCNQWQGKTVVNPIQDHLDAPQDCLARPGCPARSAENRQVVCPFGFWGLMHQIEQPLQQIKPTSVDAVPESLQARNFAQDGVLLWKAQQKLRCAIGVNRQFANDDQVFGQIQTVIPSQELDIEYSTDSDRILALIKDGGRHFFYFFCHGVIEDGNFKLDFSPGSISSAGLYPFDINWPDQPKPLFILNGCETTAITPELVQGFLEKLRLLGASGVVGTEIPVVVNLAVPFGRLLMYYMLTGSSIGEAFLKLRSHLLRQGNPLGLAYTYYAPTDLHLHQEKDCAWCRAHGLPQ